MKCPSSLVPGALWALLTLSVHILQATGIRLESRYIEDSFVKRDQISGSPTGNGSVPLNDQQNTQYLANITVGGSDFIVIVDTGSSDLWVAGQVPQTKDLNISAGITYAVGNAEGSINLASVQFVDHNITDQAYLLVNNTSTFSQSKGISGLVGLGPGQGSVIAGNFANTTGAPILDRIFQQNTSAPNFISFLLQRNNDPTQAFNGELTIGSLLPGLETISSQAKIPVAPLKNDSRVNQHWTIQLDKNGIIGPDGKAISKSSIVPDNDGRLFAVVDSGFTLPQVPRSVSDAIYGRVQGANYSVEEGLWTIPCQQELNISFWIGGVKFPVHPLDVSMSEFQLKDANGNEVCVGAFQPITSAFSLAGQFDLILGMSFLRNAYTLLDFGDFVTGSTSTDAPYIQMLNTTDTSQAHQDFVNVRMGGVDTTSDPKYKLLSKGQSSPVPLSERVTHTEQKVIRYLPAIVVISVGAFLLLLGFCAFRYIRKRRALRRQPAPISDPIESGGQRKYKPLDDTNGQMYLNTMQSSQSVNSFGGGGPYSGPMQSTHSVNSYNHGAGAGAYQGYTGYQGYAR